MRGGLTGPPATLPNNDKADGLMRRVVGRANNNANANGGLVYANANNASSNSNTNNGSRLANRQPQKIVSTAHLHAMEDSSGREAGASVTAMQIGKLKHHEQGRDW